MAIETKTVQCYPSDSVINQKISECEAFGWELTGNQCCKESNGSTTYTYNKLTFLREKGAAWYSEVAELENKYNMLMNGKPYEKKPSKILFIISIFVFIFAIGMLIPTLAMLSSGFMIMPGVPAIVLTVLAIALFVIYGVKKSRYKKEYNARYGEWERTDRQEALNIRKQAEALVNG